MMHSIWGKAFLQKLQGMAHRPMTADKGIGGWWRCRRRRRTTTRAQAFSRAYNTYTACTHTHTIWSSQSLAETQQPLPLSSLHYASSSCFSSDNDDIQSLPLWTWCYSDTHTPHLYVYLHHIVHEYILNFVWYCVYIIHISLSIYIYGT